ncbi:hypothetical protein ACQ86G_12615 [Roseateles chitinivorans]|uniref:hypothetical protein n=1 Tax=Roseateles chitinivorans TaxID=2917965 RepID=UPI003D67CD67
MTTPPSTTSTWPSELARFLALQRRDQIIWLSRLIHLISMYARDTYEVGTDDVVHPANLRRFNELIHRVASLQRSVAESSPGRPPEALFAMVEEQLASLGVDSSHLLDSLQ